MAPSQMDYINETTLSYSHKKFNSSYTHKKFGKRETTKQTSCSQATALFRPYALNDNTPRKRRLETQTSPRLPPTPPQTPPQTSAYTSPQTAMQATITTPTYTGATMPMIYTPAPAPTLNHQAFAFMLQKQRAVLQMRQLLSINPDANTWPLEWRNALYTLLHQ